MRFGLLIGLLLLAYLFAPSAWAGSGYHTCTGKNGVKIFTNLPCNKQNSSGISGPRDVFYKSKTPAGAIEFSSKPPVGRAYVAVEVGGCPACRLDSTINWTATRLNLTDYAATIAAAASEHGVDQALVRAIIHAESAFNPEALSRKGAQGLMQLMPGTAGQYGVTDAFDPEQNIKAGVQHLAGLLKRYGGDTQLVAAAYNAGEGAVAKYKNTVPPYAETKVYVERVGILQKRYSEAVNPAAGVTTPVVAAGAPG